MLTRAPVLRKGTSRALMLSKQNASIARSVVYPVASFSSTSSSAVPDESVDKLVKQLSKKQSETVSQVVPWFLRSMPKSYFKQVGEATRREHMNAVSAIHDLRESDLTVKVKTKREDGNIDLTLIDTNTSGALLASRAKELPNIEGYSLGKNKVFSTKGGEYCFNILTYEPLTEDRPDATMEDGKLILELSEKYRNGTYAGPEPPIIYDESLYGVDSLKEYFAKCTATYVANSHPRRFMIQRAMYEKVVGTDNVEISLDKYYGSGGPQEGTGAWITVAAGNALTEDMLTNALSLVSSYGIDIFRAHLDTVEDSKNSYVDAIFNKETAVVADKNIPGYVTLLRLLVAPSEHQSFEENELFSKNQDSFVRDLKRSLYCDDSAIDLSQKLISSKDGSSTRLGLVRAEVISTLCNVVHGPIVKDSPTFASPANIVESCMSSDFLTNIAVEIADLFLARFNPSNPLSDTNYVEQRDSLRKRLSNIQKEDSRVALTFMLDAVDATLKTNFYNDDRFALSLRIQPSLMFTKKELKEQEIPFGVFFSHGRYFNGFHCRFRDIARGGMRIVSPSKISDVHAESSRQFAEVYGLSLGQQYKNKDIPEGGSKAVVLVNKTSLPDDPVTFSRLKRKCVRSFVDSIFDLTVEDEKFKSTVVDKYGEPELIYLGPDEQVINQDIDWITERAAVRGYPVPRAFMSSKADAGFNHKEFGVTSEGVVVFLEEALKHHYGKDPRKDEFTVKITGGTGGDVAGNLVKIMVRDYGDNCKILAMCDGEAVIEDPNGLDHAELMRLVDDSRDLLEFDRSKLSPDGELLVVHEEVNGKQVDNDEAINRRNSMPFTVKADVFVPAGGRPNTLNSNNYRDYLLDDGSPSAPLIVEGANIFLTKDARKNLFRDAKVLCIKDSSANKCGVVTSSCEIQASMLLSKDEFMQYKQELVDDVLDHLRYIAKVEANLMFRLYDSFEGPLPYFSESISRAINRVTDALIEKLQPKSVDDPLVEELRPLIRRTIPRKLADVAWDRVPSGFPLSYQKASIASALGSMLVYKEGVHLVQNMPKETVADRAIEYYRANKEAEELEFALDRGTLTKEESERVKELIRNGGARTIMGKY